MDAERRDTILVIIALLGVLLCFWIPMPWGAIPAAVTLLIAGAKLIPPVVRSKREARQNKT